MMSPFSLRTPRRYRRWAALGAVALGLGAVFAFTEPSAAWERQNGPWCAYLDNSYDECAYFSQRQCLKTVRGIGGACYPNPRYAAFPEDNPPVRKPRRSR